MGRSVRALARAEPRAHVLWVTLFLLSSIVSVWLIGDQSDPARGDVDPGNEWLSSGHVTTIGVLASAFLLGILIAVLILILRRKLSPVVLILFILTPAAASVVGAYIRLATMSNTVGANMGAGLVALLGFPWVIGLIVLCAMVSSRYLFSRPKGGRL